MDQESKKKFTEPELIKLNGDDIDDLYAFSLVNEELAAEGGGY